MLLGNNFIIGVAECRHLYVLLQQLGSSINLWPWKRQGLSPDVRTGSVRGAWAASSSSTPDRSRLNTTWYWICWFIFEVFKNIFNITRKSYCMYIQGSLSKQGELSQGSKIQRRRIIRPFDLFRREPAPQPWARPAGVWEFIARTIRLHYFP